MSEPTTSTRTPPARAPLPDAWWRLPLRTRQLIAVAILVGLLVLVFGLVWWLTGDSSGSGTPQESASEQPGPDEATVFVASLPPERVATWDALAQCESEGDWGRATGNGYYGGLQFSQASWFEVGGQGSPHETSREEQIMRAEMLYELQGWGAWPNCAAQLGLQ